MLFRLNRTTAVILAGVALAPVFGAPAALAQEGQIIVQAPASNVRIERVGYADLNLATRDGEWALERRVNGAVERVCLHDGFRWYGLSVPDYTTCADRAWRVARPQVIGAVYRARLAANGRY